MSSPPDPQSPPAPARWRQLEALLERACALDGAARQRFLDDISLASLELRAELDRLLAQPISDGAATRVLDPAAPPVRRSGDRFIGQRIGPFLLTELIGTGGMGAVYRGERVEGGFRQTCAIKLILVPHHENLERFARERQILAELRHPHIAQLLDGGETADGLPYFTMEFVAGRTLDDYADSVGADVDARLRLLRQVAEALAHAHRQGVLHRDIKPSNIVVCEGDNVKLLDFGIARLLGSTEQTALTVGQSGPMTPDYAAPEQFTGALLTVATDIYQFGTLAYRLLTGRLPLSATHSGPIGWGRAVAEQAPLPLAEALREARGNDPFTPPGQRSHRYRLRCADDLEKMFGRMLAKQPEQRYPDMAAVIADLDAYLAGRPIAAATRRGVPTRRRRRWLWSGAGLLLAALLAGLAMQLPWPVFGDDWNRRPALVAFGLHRENLHVSDAASANLIRQALLKDAGGERPAALALLETAHHNDPRTPVPAMLLGYWGSAMGVAGRSDHWFAAAQERAAPLHDPVLDLALGFLRADANVQVENALRYSAALLELRQDAWFLRMARAHLLGVQGFREAATRELALIDVPDLDHRKLVDAIADRASYGDLAGARAAFARFPPQPDDPKYLDLQARLAYTSGDLHAARDAYLDVVKQARRLARFDLEGRGLLYAGVMSGALGDYAQAAELLQPAKRRLGERRQYRYAADAALLLAELAALAGDRAGFERELAAARELAVRAQNPLPLQFAALLAARVAPELATPAPPREDVVDLLLHARRELRNGDRATARRSLLAARTAGVEQSPFVEEAALIAQALGEPLPALAPIDPPFTPYARFGARWALGLGASVAPQPPR